MLMWSATWPSDVKGLARDFFAQRSRDVVEIAKFEIKDRSTFLNFILVLDHSSDFKTLCDTLNRDGSGDDYVHVNIGSTELSANHNIKQMVDVVQKSEKVIGQMIPV